MDPGPQDTHKQELAQFGRLDRRRRTLEGASLGRGSLGRQYITVSYSIV